MEECERKSRDRDDLREKWRGPDRDVEITEDEGQSWPLDVLASLDSDHWPASLIKSIFSIAENAGPHDADVNLVQTKSRLRQLYESIPATTTPREAWVLAWEAYLDLPLWKRRHELYSAWVSTQVLAAAIPLARRIHTEDRTLRFQFSGSHLATLPTLTPAVHLWAELRSPIKHRPIGRGRKAKIQPDFTLLQDPLTGQRSAFLVIECKQYKTASKKNFVAALIDYGRGRPHAQIILVNYGPAPAHWLDEIPLDLRDRLFLFGDFRPGSPEVIDRFQTIVREALLSRGPLSERLGSKKQASSAAHESPPLRKIQLLWNSGRDLDLHLILRSPRSSYRVAYSKRGSLEEAPWMQLDRDVQSAPGQEEIQVIKYFDGVYQCFVHSYSGESFQSCEAEVLVLFKDSTIKITPPRGGLRWWHVFDWNSQFQVLSIVNTLSDLAPEAQ